MQCGSHSVRQEELTPDIAGATDYPDAVHASWLIKRLSDRWALPILVSLQDKPLRFANLQRALETVSHRMLIRSLKGLERDGLVSRHEFTSVPPRVTYELTKLGVSLLDQIHVFTCWTQENAQAILAANETFDSRNAHCPRFLAT